MFKDYDIKKMPGHWLLARMGKRVLRPGGKELTRKMITKLNITQKDSVVEFAPGIGSTSKIVFSKNPKEYTGVDLNKEAIDNLTNLSSNTTYKFINKNILDTGLENEYATVILGEAVLTMQSDEEKEKILKEAHRILEKGGRYGIHEICLQPDNLETEYKDNIKKDLSKAIRVNARPLTIGEWEKMFVDAGFRVDSIDTNPMHLLRPLRLIQDEGIRIFKIVFNVLTTRYALNRILNMRRAFNKHQINMKSISIIAVKE